MTKPSYGRGPLGRIYERLRKRSYRKLGIWKPASHAYYVRGVKDALDAVREERVATE